MQEIQTRPWDVTEHLETAQEIAAYLEAALEEGDPQLIAAAVGDVARARGMSLIAEEAGIRRESLYKTLSSEGNPEFATVLRVLHALGFRLQVKENHMATSHLGHSKSIAEKAYEVARTEFKGRSFSRAELYEATVRRYGDIKNESFLTADWSINQKSGSIRRKNGKPYKRHTFLFKRPDGDFELYTPNLPGSPQ